ncbi:hypothetical protein CEXT_259951 [Caerostris extrusa]|uniref:Uncharacterized protein n=1 Tax=Caerostris extrusa TaxID=172846 RepID=A0AAV4TUB9_CAEEX|nr:hypothetical protein CEXT_259951 [Caerostris extrusa]
MRPVTALANPLITEWAAWMLQRDLFQTLQVISPVQESGRILTSPLHSYRSSLKKERKNMINIHKPLGEMLKINTCKYLPRRVVLSCLMNSEKAVLIFHSKDFQSSRIFKGAANGRPGGRLELRKT